MSSLKHDEKVFVGQPFADCCVDVIIYRFNNSSTHYTEPELADQVK